MFARALRSCGSRQLLWKIAHVLLPHRLHRVVCAVGCRDFDIGRAYWHIENVFTRVRYCASLKTGKIAIIIWSIPTTLALVMLLTFLRVVGMPL